MHRWILAAAALAGGCTSRADAAPEPVDAAALLAALGKQTLAALDPPAPPVGDGEIAVLGACTRPTSAQRDAITNQILASDRDAPRGDAGADDSGLGLRFGCIDPAGTIVDLEYERGHTGVWCVVRVGAAGVTTIAEHRGEARSDWMEWADEVTVSTLALVDVDGDGNHDAIVVRSQHEGGSSSSAITPSLWLSRSGTLVSQAFELSDEVAIARGQTVGAGKPIVLQADSHRAPEVPRRYRCLEPDGTLDLCAAIDEVRRVDHAIEIATWFVSGHEYGPLKTAVPDRDLLAKLLAVLRVPVAARAYLLAAVPATTPALRVADEIARVVAPKENRRFGELLDPPTPPDPRPPALMALLGDATCDPASAADRARAVAAIAAWAAAHDPAALVDHGDCTKGARCKYARATAPIVGDSCAAGDRGYYSARWTYIVDGSGVARDAVFYRRGGAVTPVAVATTAGDFNECAACGGPPGPGLDARFTRHGAALIAIVYTSETLSLAVDGVATTRAASGASWYAFEGEPRAEMPDVIHAGAADGEHALHWDGTWKALPVAMPTAAPPTEPVAAWLWHEAQQQAALAELRAFSPDAWTRDAATRAAIERDLAIVGADPVVIARVADAGGRLAP